jgi:DNA (cytosine-5)-methyltransferase 1
LNWYNENGPYAAAWLRNLIVAGHIAPGDVDERSIVDVRSDDLAGYVQCHFFAGIGGWSHALRLAGWPDDRPVWTGSCPCQPFSTAGKQKGFADERHLWPEFRRLIAERLPSVVFGEQVASAIDWLRLVRSDLEALGYAVGAMPIEAASAGADHLRDRFWFVADRKGEQVGTAGQSRQRGDVGDDPDERRGEGRPEHGVRSWRDASTCTSRAIPDGRDLAKSRLANQRGHDGGPRSEAVASCGETRAANGDASDGPRPSSGGDMANPESTTARTGNDLFARQPDAWSGRNMGDAACGERRERECGSGGERPLTARGPSADYHWVAGADGKARRVKPGIRLLAHDVPARVAKLRAFGNAIVPQVAAEFIVAYLDGLNV